MGLGAEWDHFVMVVIKRDENLDCTKDEEGNDEE